MSACNTTRKDTYEDDKAPPFGHEVLKYFGFDEKYINLNNGSYGSLPRAVSRYCIELTEKVESNPDKYHRLEFQPLLVAARKRIATLIGAETDECVFVPNTTSGVNTVLRNFEWEAGDILIGFSTTYYGVSRVLQYISDTRPNPTLSTIQLAFPTTHAAILQAFRDHIRALKASCGVIEKSEGSPKIVAVIDSVVSNPGVYMPWKDMVKICREEGVWSLVDAAHSVGQEIDLRLAEVQPDFWISNCHKWLFAKRGSAVLYVPKRHQHLIKSAVPTSWDYVSPSDALGGPEAPNFIMQHEWPGAIDFAPYISVIPALDFRSWLGGEARINEYCHSLALSGGIRLAEILNTRLLDETNNSELTLNMVNVELPLPTTPSEIDQGKINEFLEHKLLYDWNVYAVHLYHGDCWWIRCSAQIWNEVSDFEYLGKALIELCSEVKQSILNI
ncbi:PLP-dependent transferase [Crucibulum laeve]|uniref:PLP-dependent transferase n=1 Tax=Crucibulum laeve TaxID=68775 RepID=A0A5C3LKH3_9AGAR|nr:PLP-dependent transferase [Crucibulum laeve]